MLFYRFKYCSPIDFLRKLMYYKVKRLINVCEFDMQLNSINKNSPKVASLTDIAKLSGFSVATVSKVLNNSQGSTVCAANREQILKIANSLKYVKNDLARSIQSGVSNFIAFVDIKFGNGEHSNRILDGILSGLQGTKYFPKFFPYGDSKTAIDNISTLFGQKPAGVLAISRDEDYMGKISSFCVSHNVPQVTIGHSKFFGKEMIVSSEDIHGQCEAVEYLHTYGHRRIAHLTTGKPAVYSQRREQGYLDGMKKCGLSENIEVLHIDLYKEDVINSKLETKIQELIRKKKITAFTCVSDPYAMVTIRAVNRIGLCVPENISVIGHANYSLCEFSNPPLTTIAEPFAKMGRLAVKELLNRINGASKPFNKELKLSTFLIERESVGKTKQKTRKEKIK